MKQIFIAYQSNLQSYPNWDYIGRFQIHHIIHLSYGSLLRLNKNRLKGERPIFVILPIICHCFKKIPMQLHSKQYCFKGLSPQQSPPSNWHGPLLLISSHDPSEIHSSNPPAIAAIRKLGKLQCKEIWI